jgi:DNA-binding CsgD family transcriptional regulator
MDPDGGRGFTVHVPIPGWPTAAGLQEMDDAVDQHPLVRWFAATGDLHPTSIGRVPARFFTPRGRSVIHDQLEPAGLEQQLSIPYSLGPRHYRAFVLARAGCDFTDTEVATALQVQSLLRLLDRQCRLLGRCAPKPADRAGLSGRELAVLRLVADGLTVSAIAGRLALSPRTVHRHLDHAYRKLGVSDRVRAVLAATEAGLLKDRSSDTAAHYEPAAEVRNCPGGTVFAIERGVPAA